MRLSYDFHIHTDASPCADGVMTPHNIVQMAKLLERQAIAITDHNTCVNCESVMRVGESEGVLVIPGMEIECQEEFHLIALFPTLQQALTFQAYVDRHRFRVLNKPHIFGHQHKLDASGEVIGEIEELLLTVVQQSVQEISTYVRALGGVIYPAHIDRQSYSILATLGDIPDDLGFKQVELSAESDVGAYQNLYSRYKIMQGTDAHYLEDLCKDDFFMEIEELSIMSIFDALNR